MYGMGQSSSRGPSPRRSPTPAAAASAAPDRWKTGRAAASTGNYVVPLDAAPSGITRPLVEIHATSTSASRTPSCSSPPAAPPPPTPSSPGWCGEVRVVVYNDNGNVTMVYRVTIRATDGEVHREAAGTALLSDARLDDPVAAAEEAAFCKACARLQI